MMAILFVAVYISIGLILKLEAVSYLLLGIPLTIIFQLCVARKPLHQLWLRNEEHFRLNMAGRIIALCFIIYPAYKIIHLAMQGGLTLLSLGYYSSAMLGAFGAGYCYSRFTKKTVKDFLLCFAIVVVVRISFYFSPFVLGKQPPAAGLAEGLSSLLIYIPVAFVVEEVVFRGMLDAYVHPSKKAKGFWSALFVSCSWGLWHLPLSAQAEASVWLVIGPLTISLWGIVLSLFWRRTGNLAVPGFSHAFADAVRDAFIN